MNPNIDRRAELAKEFDGFWKKVLNTQDSLFAQMTINDFVELKKAISCINNIVTLLVTDRFIDFLLQNHVISAEQAEKMHQDVNQTHANTNGFDIECKENVKIVAEVKCNIPVGKNTFGAAQETGIMKDIKHLYCGKTKSNINEQEIGTYYKFMVVLDSDGVKNSVQKLVYKMHNHPDYANIPIAEYEANIQLDTNTVYIAYISEIN